MNISYVTTYNARDINNWSGTGTYIAKSLEKQGNEIEYIGNLKSNRKLSGRLKGLYNSKFLKKGYLYDRTFYIADQYAKQVEKVLNVSTDLIFSPGTIPIAFIKSNKPKVFYTDATFAGMLNFYELFTNLSDDTIRDGNVLEQTALETSKLCIYSSDWAAETAIKNYHVDPKKIKVVPFGANIEEHRSLSVVKDSIDSRNTQKCKLLFLGVDWVRKNGDLAMEVTAKLNESGLETELHVVGLDNLPLKHCPPFIHNHGFISKSDEKGKNKISDIISNSHFLILPSIADCTPIVFPEANSFGVPCLTTNVGGIPTIIKNNVNGHMFPINNFTDECYIYILKLFNNYSEYRELSLSSFNEYENRLNWNVAGKSIMKLIKDL